MTYFATPILRVPWFYFFGLGPTFWSWTCDDECLSLYSNGLWIVDLNKSLILLLPWMTYFTTPILRVLLFFLFFGLGPTFDLGHVITNAFALCSNGLCICSFEQVMTYFVTPILWLILLHPFCMCFYFFGMAPPFDLGHVMTNAFTLCSNAVCICSFEQVMIYFATLTLGVLFLAWAPPFLNKSDDLFFCSGTTCECDD